MFKTNKEQISAIIRHVASAVGAICLTRGYLDENAVIEITGLVTSTTALIWSIVEKKEKKK